MIHIDRILNLGDWRDEVELDEAKLEMIWSWVLIFIFKTGSENLKWMMSVELVEEPLESRMGVFLKISLFSKAQEFKLI